MAYLRIWIIFCFLGFLLPSSSAQTTLSVVTTEKGLRSLATKTVIPEFPAGAFKLHQFGVAVAQVHLEPSGAIRSINILEAPSSAIATSMEEAINGWTFRPGGTHDGRLLAYSGKITYYFLQDRGKALVYSSTESFYCGQQSSSK